jgi:pimeloyl-ACP methyl ester carboxylesterase
MPAIAAAGRGAFALDLPGFGASAKPPDAPYTLDYQARTVDRFLDALGIAPAALVLHDLGGPVGLLWAVRNSDRVERLVILDTLLYPRRLLSLRALLRLARLPRLGEAFVRPGGLRLLLRLGVARRDAFPPEVMDHYRSPFARREDQRTLLRTLLQPRFDEFDEIHAGLARLREIPALIAWADRDLLLPRSEMRRIAAALPGAATTTIRHAGHFLQEDQPEQLRRIVAAFLGDPRST